MYRISTDKLLDELRNHHTEKLVSSPEVKEAISYIHATIGQADYIEIEDHISMIMDYYESRGFNLGFKLCFKILSDLTFNDLLV